MRLSFLRNKSLFVLINCLTISTTIGSYIEINKLIIEQQQQKRVIYNLNHHGSSGRVGDPERKESGDAHDSQEKPFRIRAEEHDHFESDPLMQIRVLDG